MKPGGANKPNVKVIHFENRRDFCNFSRIQIKIYEIEIKTYLLKSNNFDLFKVTIFQLWLIIFITLCRLFTFAIVNLLQDFNCLNKAIR